MRTDHAVKHVCHAQRSLTARNIFPAEIISHRQHRAEVIRRMTPFRSQPGVVKVQPTHHGADIKRRLHRLQPVISTRYPRPIRHLRSRHHRPQQPGASRELQRQHAAGQRIQQTIKRSIPCLLTGNITTQHIISNILQQHIRRRPPGISYAHIRHIQSLPKVFNIVMAWKYVATGIRSNSHSQSLPSPKTAQKRPDNI